MAKAPYLRPILVMNLVLCGCRAVLSLPALVAALKTRRTGVKAAAVPLQPLAEDSQGGGETRGGRGRAQWSWACSVSHQRQYTLRRSTCTALPWGGDPEYPRETLVKGALPDMTSSVWFLERDIKGVFVLGYKERMASFVAT